MFYRGSTFQTRNFDEIKVFQSCVPFFSLGSWPAAASGQYADRNYNYLALSWSNNGDLFFNLNGQETHVSSNFAPHTNYRLVHAKSFWIIGGK